MEEAHNLSAKKMKLRIRSLETKQTLKIETPTPSTLQSVKEAIALKTSSSPQTIHLSLNRKDELIASAPQDSLSSLGIASGDLIYYTQNPSGFSAAQGAPIQVSTQICDNSSTFDKKVEPLETPTQENMEICDNSSAIDKNVETLEIPIEENQESFDLDERMDDFDHEEGETLVKNLSLVPRFLRKVYKEEVGDGGSEEDYKLLIISVHAVFLESGFVCFDSVEKKKIEGFRLPVGWREKQLLSVRYTLSDLIGDDDVKTVELKFHKMGKFVIVHGCLSGGNPVGSFKLDVSQFVPLVKSVCSSDCEADGSLGLFELWKIAKDGLALPLLIDLCEKNGLDPPPCFTRLPTELKLKILELLPGVDVGRVGCVSSELRYLTSNNDLWKQKYTEEFALSDSGVEEKNNWKENYVNARERLSRKRRFHCRRVYRPMRGDPGPSPFPGMGGGVPNPRPFGFPGIIGGDWDRFPAFPAPFGSRQINGGPARRNFGLHYNLDSFDA